MSTISSCQNCFRKTFGVLFVSGLIACATLLSSSDAHADAAANYMNKVKVDLLRAAKSGTAGAFMSPIRKHADIRTISLFSLGSYAKKLPNSRRSNYYAGVAQFMARYFSSQTTQYNVVKARVLRPSVREGNDYFVNSEVFLKNGQKYNVRWRLKRRKSGFKIVDVQVLGFWLTPFQRNLFRDYIQKHNGNVNALLIALSY
ncbi:MAG: ABC transporter substrate-binding protein [Methyloligellaceae bacterium]